MAAGWKKILTEEDGNLATANLTADASRTYTLAASSTLKFVSDNGTELIKLTSGPVGAQFDQIDLTAPEINLRHSVGTASPALKFYESDNDAGDHYVGLKSPSSIAASYTLTLPTTDGDANQVLKTDGSGTLSWVDQSSGGGSIDGSGAANRVALWSDADTLTSESGITYASGTDTIICGNITASTSGDGSGNVTGVTGGFQKITVGVSTANSSGDFGTGTRMFAKLGSGTIAGGRIYYRNPGAQGYPWATADHTSEDKATGMLIVATDNATTDELITDGVVKMASNQGWSTTVPGKPLYLGSTGGGVQSSPPTTSNYYSRIVGYVIDASNRLIYFNPDRSWVRIS